MRHKLEIGIPVIGLVVAALISGSLAAGQNAAPPSSQGSGSAVSKDAKAAAAQNAAPPSLLEQLQKRYKFVQMGSDSSGPKVIDPGTLLDVQKGGVLGVPGTNSVNACAATYQNGTLHPPGKGCTMLRGKGLPESLKHCPVAAICGKVTSLADVDTSQTQYFNVGDKVYPSNISVDVTHEKISFFVVACDTCNKTNPPTAYKAEVDFHFARGYLESPDVSKVKDTIAEVFSIDNSGDAQQSQGAQAPPDQQAQRAPAQVQEPAPAQTTPQAPTGPTLTNDDILQQVNAKLADSLIIAQIKKSACAFDTSTDGLVKLKQAGVSDAVLQAMVEKQ